MAQPVRSKPIDSWTERWWVTLPLISRRVWPGITMALVDGFYLVAFRPVAILAPPLALVAGLLIGSVHLGFRDVFSESLWVMQLAAVLGMLSANLGAMFVIGFGIGDFFLAHRDWLSSFNNRGPDPLYNVLHLRLPLLIEYGLLAMLATGVPIAAKGLVVHFLPPPRLGGLVRGLVQTVVYTALVGLFVYLWAQAVPFLMRPVFTWWGNQAPTQAMAHPLQFFSIYVVLFALGAALLRGILELLASSFVRLARRPVFVQAQLLFAPPLRPWYAPLGPWPPTLFRSAWATFMMAGILSNQVEAIVVFVLIAVLGTAKSGLLPVPNLGPWPALIARIWLPLRLVAVSAVLFFLARLILTNFAQSRTFIPMVVFTGIALVVGFLFVPGVNPKKGKTVTGEGRQTA